MSAWKNRPLFPPGFKRSSFAEAVEVLPVPDNNIPEGSGVYLANLRGDWCIGFVPHGGYLTALLLTASCKHITTHPKLLPLNQPHAIQISSHFLNSCTVGPATITVTPIKTGRQFTFLRTVLSQNNGTRTCIEGIIVYTHFPKPQTGVTLQTVSPLSAQGIPDREKDCVVHVDKGDPSMDVWPVSRKLVYMVPRGYPNGSSKETPSVREHWVKLVDGGLMNVPTLGYLSDMFLPIPENYPTIAKSYWYPTLSLSVEIKRIPPPKSAGWEWLFCRIESREIRDSRMDISVDIFDEDGNLVAIAHQVAIMLGNDRNKPRAIESEKSKL